MKRQLLAATALLAVLGLAGPSMAIEPKKTTEQAASSTGQHVPDPGVTQLENATGCVDAQGSAKTLSAKQTTTQTAPSPCPADQPKSQ
jgi:hypothetical protein